MPYMLGPYMKCTLRYTCMTHRLASEDCHGPEMLECPQRSSASLSLYQESWLGQIGNKMSESIICNYIYIYTYIHITYVYVYKIIYIYITYHYIYFLETRLARARAFDHTCHQNMRNVTPRPKGETFTTFTNE